MASRPFHHPTTTAILLGLFSAACNAMTPTNGVEFLFPTQGATLHYNDYVQVQYVSNFSDPWLVAFCESAEGTIGEKHSQGVGSFNNTATIKLDWSGSDTPCWFDLKPNSSAPSGSGANGDQWSFDVSQRAATTVGLVSTTATPTSTTPAASSDTSTSPTASTASTSSLKQSNGLSTGAQAGIGIGAAIAGVGAGAAVVFMFMRRQRRAARRAVAAGIERRPAASGGGSSGVDEVKYPEGYPPQRGASSVMEMDGGYPGAQELHAAPGIYEMPARAR